MDIRRRPNARAAVLGLLALAAPVPGDLAGQVALSGKVSAETLGFISEPLFPGQSFHAISFVAQPRLDARWAEGRIRFVAAPFLRYDATRSGRTHADLGTLALEMDRGAVHLGVGFRQVSWGVAESRELVNVVNQTDRAEHPMSSRRLGQPMVALALPTAGGAVEVLALAGFRPRTFPGPVGRLRGSTIVDATPRYVTGSSRRVDWAARWSRDTGRGRFGFSFFRGLDRAPALVPWGEHDPDRRSAVYDRAWQIGSEGAVALGSWTATLEAVVRDEHAGLRHAAMNLGIRRTVRTNVAGGEALTLVVEYVRDSRGGRATSGLQEDFYGQLAFASLLDPAFDVFTAIVVDRVTGDGAFMASFDRKVRQSTVTTEGWTCWGTGFGPLRRDAYITVELTRSF